MFGKRKENDKKIKTDSKKIIDENYISEVESNLEWKNIKIFISSTFKDMHAERNYLITEVFPELKEWCLERRILLTEIDLRWGVTIADAESGNTINACLQSIDNCRPFFLCFIGQRRGWVPILNETPITERTYINYPHVKEYIGNLSITEMEIEHATLAPMIKILENDSRKIHSKHSLFFFRENPFINVELTETQRKVYLNENKDDDEKVKELKNFIKNDFKTFNYSCDWNNKIVTSELVSTGEEQGGLTNFNYQGTPLKEIIILELKRQIREEFPDNKPIQTVDSYLEDALLQKLETDFRSLDFVGKEKEIQYLNNFLKQNEKRILLVNGEEGIGKSTLLCYWNKTIKEKGINSIIRICQTTSESYSVKDLLHSIGTEVGIFNGDKEINKIDFLDNEFFNKLKSKNINVLIICDFIQIQGEWPTYIKEVPEDFHVIISSYDKKYTDSSHELIIEGFVNDDEKIELIDKYMDNCLKNLDKKQEELILSKTASRSPLFLGIILNEIKSFGSFEELNKKIDNFGTDIPSAFKELIKTLENDTLFPSDFSNYVLLMLTLSRYGLTEKDLLVGLENLNFNNKNITSTLRIFLRRINNYTLYNKGVYSIKYASLKRVILSENRFIETQIRRTLIMIYKSNILNNTNSKKDKNSTSTDLLRQLEIINDYNGILEVFKNDKLLDGVFPSTYLMEYKNNQNYFQIFINENLEKMLRGRNYLGFTLRDSKNGRKILRQISLILVQKSANLMKKSNDKYPDPKYKIVEKFYEEKDMKSYYEYRTSYFEIPAYFKASIAYALLGIKNEEKNQEIRNFFIEYENILSKNGLSAFMNYLSKFGNGQLGLEGSLELRADSVVDALKFLRKEKEKFF